MKKIRVESIETSIFAKQFMSKCVVVSFNDDWTVFAVKPKTIFIYSNKTMWNSILEIFMDATIKKLISRPVLFLNSFLDNSSWQNCELIVDYLKIYKNANIKLINDLNMEIINYGLIEDSLLRAENIVILMLKYLTCKSNKKHYNDNRECYLLYLSAYNEILSKYGPMKFNDLINKVKKYPYLCDINPAIALESLISIGAFGNDKINKTVFIPDTKI